MRHKGWLSSNDKQELIVPNGGEVAPGGLLANCLPESAYYLYYETIEARIGQYFCLRRVLSSRQCVRLMHAWSALGRGLLFIKLGITCP